MSLICKDIEKGSGDVLVARVLVESGSIRRGERRSWYRKTEFVVWMVSVCVHKQRLVDKWQGLINGC
jgi:hypothetical protein